MWMAVYHGCQTWFKRKHGWKNVHEMNSQRCIMGLLPYKWHLLLQEKKLIGERFALMLGKYNILSIFFNFNYLTFLYLLLVIIQLFNNFQFQFFFFFISHILLWYQIFIKKQSSNFNMKKSINIIFAKYPNILDIKIQLKNTSTSKSLEE